MQKLKKCPRCFMEVPYLIQVRLQTTTTERCEPCDESIRKATAKPYLPMDVSKFRPKFMS